MREILLKRVLNVKFIFIVTILPICNSFTIQTKSCHLSKNCLSRKKQKVPYLFAVPVSRTIIEIKDSKRDQNKDIFDWDFLDAVYLITCPPSSSQNKEESRIERVKDILAQVNLLSKVEIMEFQTDDEDRVRGCYTSHMSVLRAAQEKFQLEKKKGNKKGLSWFSNLFPSSAASKEIESELDKSNKLVLVLEDNLSISNSLSPDLLSSIQSFLSDDSAKPDVLHLSYTPFVPNFSIQRSNSEEQSDSLSSLNNNQNIIQLSTGIGSALGTTAYILSENGIQQLLEKDANGYYQLAIPDVMTQVFSSKRYAVYPSPFLRSFSTKSLVNPQLDTLRQILFIPLVYRVAENILVFTGISTNLLLPILVSSLAVISFISLANAAGNISDIIQYGTSSGNVIWNILSTMISLLSLGILGIGAALAPKPQPNEKDESD